MSLTEVLPTEPVTPTPWRRARDARRRRAPASRRAGPAPRRPRRPQGAAARCRLDRQRPRRRRRSRRRRTRRRRRSPRAGRRRGRQARSRPSRSSRAAGEPGSPSATNLGPDRRRDLLGAEVHAAPPSLRSSSTRDLDGHRRGPCDRPRTPAPARAPCPRSRPCRPARARPSARAIAARRSTSTSTVGPLLDPGEDLGDDRLGVLGARVVGGDDRQIGELRPDSAHLRPLVAIAITAGAEDGYHPARGQPPRRPQHVLQRVGGMGVVDKHPEALALARSARSAPAPAPARAKPAAAVSGSTPSAVAAAKAPSALATLKCPGQSGAQRGVSPLGPRIVNSAPSASKDDIASDVVGLGALGGEGQALEFPASRRP